jgi:hypothetical protein
MIKCNQKIKYLVNPQTEEIIDKTGGFHNITEEMLDNGWVRVWWREDYAEFEGKETENITKAFNLLINKNILKDYKRKDYHIIYSLDNQWYHTVMKGEDL